MAGNRPNAGTVQAFASRRVGRIRGFKVLFTLVIRVRRVLRRARRVILRVARFTLPPVDGVAARTGTGIPALQDDDVPLRPGAPSNTSRGHAPENRTAAV